MAFYDYRCPECRLIQEIERNMSKPPGGLLCLECEVTMERVYSPVGFTDGKERAGSVVEKHLKDIKEEIREQKKKIFKG